MAPRRTRSSQSHRDAHQGVTQAAFGRSRGLSRQAVRKAIETGRIRPGKGLLKNGRIDPRAAARALRESTDPSKQRQRRGRPEENGDEHFAAARARRESALASIAELDLQKAQENLVLRSDVRTAADEVGRRVQERILAVPERLMDGLESLGITDTVRARKLISDELRLALASLADDVTPAAVPDVPAATPRAAAAASR